MRRVLLYLIMFLLALLIIGTIDSLHGKNFWSIPSTIVSIGCVLFSVVSDFTSKIESRRLRFLSDLVLIFIVFLGVYSGLDYYKAFYLSDFQIGCSLIGTVILLISRSVWGNYDKVEEKEG